MIVGANWYRFRPGEYSLNPHVKSLSFVWVVHGHGEMCAEGVSFDLKAQDIVRLPWDHRVEYQAAKHDPFMVGTIHIIPNHPSGSPVIPRVAHKADDPLLFDTRRQGDPDADFPPSIRNFANGHARRIVELGRVAIDRFTDAEYDEEYFRALAKLILLENSEWGRLEENKKIPAALESMMFYSRSQISSKLSITDIAHSGNVSPTTAQRMFSTYTGMSIAAWLRKQRIQEAAQLLRSSGLRVNEVARLVGFRDPLYFSRVFSEEFGVSPSGFTHGEIRP